MIVTRTDGGGRRRRPARPGRPGYTLFEIVLSVLLLLAAMNITVKVLGWVGSERRAADRRQWALQEVSNLLERLSAEPFERVSVARAKELTDESHAGRTLPDAAWEVGVIDESASPVKCKRVTAVLRWKDRSGGWDGPVCLTSWVYRGRKSP
jgi:hypothetical protein